VTDGQWAALEPPLPKADAGLQMTADLAIFWIATGSLQEGRHWLHRAIESNPEPTPTPNNVVSICGFVNMYLGDVDSD
jgi:hypothetical protein